MATRKRSTTKKSTKKSTKKCTSGTCRARKSSAMNNTSPEELLLMLPSVPGGMSSTPSSGVSLKELEAQLKKMKMKAPTPAIKASCTRKMTKIVKLLAEQDALTKKMGALEKEMMALVEKVKNAESGNECS